MLGVPDGGWCRKWRYWGAGGFVGGWRALFGNYEGLMTDLFCYVRVSRTMKAAIGGILAVWSLLDMVETNILG